MRAVTMNELEQIAGGLAAAHGGRFKEYATKLPPVTVTAPPLPPGGGFPPGGTGGGGDMPPDQSPSIPSGGGGGGHPPVEYNDGVHNVYETYYTSENGLNNPGDIMYGDFAERHGGDPSSHTNSDGNLAEFATEQDGLDALASLLDHNYGEYTASNLGDRYCPGTAAHPTQDENFNNNVTNYMFNHGYLNSNTAISQMSDAEFNTLLDAVSFAEGNTNM